MKKVVWKLFFSGMLLSCSMYAMDITKASDGDPVSSSEEDTPGAGKFWQSDDEVEFYGLNNTLDFTQAAAKFSQSAGFDRTIDAFEESVLAAVVGCYEKVQQWWYSKEN